MSAGSPVQAIAIAIAVPLVLLLLAVVLLSIHRIGPNEVGLVILGPLQKLDQVAYLRFASVYQAFESLEDFETAIALLRHESAERTAEPTAKSSRGSEKSPL